MIKPIICTVLSICLMTFIYNSLLMEFLWINAATACNIWGFKKEYLLVYSFIVVSGLLCWFVLWSIFKNVKGIKT